MNSVRAIQQLNQRELESAVTPEGSWHTDYRDTAFIYIGGLAFELSEGDIIAVFSQYGEPVWMKLARDKETGKSRGFAWLKYEDQRSCDLAVDNLGGAKLLDRVLRVDHTRYKPHEDEDMRDNTYGDDPPPNLHDADDADDSDADRPLLPEERELARLHDELDEDDPMRDSLIKSQREKTEAAVSKQKRRIRKDKEREERRRDRNHDHDRDHDHNRKRIKSADDRDRDHDRDGRRDRDRHTKSSHRHPSRERTRRSSRDRERRQSPRDRERRHRRASEDRHASRDDRHRSRDGRHGSREKDAQKRRRHSEDSAGSEKRRSPV